MMKKSVGIDGIAAADAPKSGRLSPAAEGEAHRILIVWALAEVTKEKPRRTDRKRHPRRLT